MSGERARFSDAAWPGAVVAACAWQAAYLQVAFANGFRFEPMLWLGFFLPGFLLNALAGALVGGVCGALVARPARARVAAVLGALAVLLVLGVYLAAPLEVAFLRKPELLRGVTVAALLWSVGTAGLAAVLHRRSSAPARGAFALVLSAALVVPAASLLRADPQAGVARASETELDAALAVAPSAAPPVLVFAVDGLEWSVLRPMIEAGELPHLARLVAEGASGPLRTFEPTYSPLIWNSIATGWDWPAHGVNEFTVASLPFAPRPPALGGTLLHRMTVPVRPLGVGRGMAVSSTVRRRRALWEVFGQAGVPTAVTAWWASYPATPFAGWLASDQAFVDQHVEPFEVGGEGAREIQQLLLSPDVRGARQARVARHYASLAANRPVEAKVSVDDAVDAIRPYALRAIANADFLGALARSGADARVWIWYDRLVDATQHLFWKYHEPGAEHYRQAPPRGADVEALADIVPLGVKLHDELLGELLAVLPEDVTVLVVSDHGFHSCPVRRTQNESFPLTGNHGDAPDGVVIVAGPGIAPGAIADMDVFDVLPTLAAYVGVPVAENLRGRARVDLFTAAHREAHPLRRVPTWELEGWRHPVPEGDAEFAPADFEDLNQLGYTD